MGNSLKESSSVKKLLLGLIAAIVVHGLLLLLKFTLIVKTDMTPDETAIKVSLLQEELDKAPVDAPQPLSQSKSKSQSKDSKGQSKDSRNPLAETVKPVVNASAHSINETEFEEIQLTSSIIIKKIVTSDAHQYKQQNKRVLSGLRKGTYEQRLLDPNRIDQRTTLSSQKITTSDGIIHKQKIRGKTICKLKGDYGEAFNDLDLAPLRGMKMGFACGDKQKQNALLNQNGKINNSDRQEWSVND